MAAPGGGELSAAAPVARLFYSPSSCGAAAFLAARLAGLPVDAEAVDLSTHRTARGADFYALNPKGNVPALLLPDGTVLNEGLACLLWIADQRPNSRLAPAPGSAARYPFLNTMAWVASELQPALGRLLSPNPEEVKAGLRARAAKQLAHLEHLLSTAGPGGGGGFLHGDRVTAPDLTAHIVLGWAKAGGIDLAAVHPAAAAYAARVRAVPAVAAARAAMATAGAHAATPATPAPPAVPAPASSLPGAVSAPPAAPSAPCASRDV